MRKALLVDLYGLKEFDLSLALGTLKAYADADPEIRETWEIELAHLDVRTPTEELVVAVMRSEAELVGFSCYSWNIHAVERVVAKMGSREKRPLIVLGGVEVTPDPGQALRRNRNADVVVAGEGEETLAVLLKALKGGKGTFGASTIGDVKGIAWREGKSVHVNALRPPIQDLSTIPSPYLSGTFGDALKGQDRVMVETARGCMYRCAYCYESRGFQKVRTFPTERAKEELSALARLGIPEVVFLDTNFNGNREHALEILRHLKRIGRKTRYAFEIRAELLDEEVIRGITALDFFVEIGLQTTNPKAIEAVNRVYDSAKFEANVKALMEHSIYRPCSFSAGAGVTIDVMVGLPYDTLKDILATFDTVFALAPSKIAVSMTKVLPGTALFEQAKKHRYKFDPEAQYQVTANRFLPKKDIESLLLFREAVDLAYNRVHAVRTIGWATADLKTKPSSVFMELGRQIGKMEKPAKELSVRELADLLAEFCEGRGSVRVAESVGSKLTAEGLLNVLQKLKERKRSWWARLFFGFGRRFLALFWGLPPLPS
ncbi:MAG: B12-binding domain-containing radical SAM protein [Planctomycetota bacterium]|jgi:radical SAM superfamily enzyme YgiQ (UPF0313 family)